MPKLNRHRANDDGMVTTSTPVPFSDGGSHSSNVPVHYSAIVIITVHQCNRVETFAEWTLLIVVGKTFVYRNVQWSESGQQQTSGPLVSMSDGRTPIM